MQVGNHIIHIYIHMYNTCLYIYIYINILSVKQNPHRVSQGFPSPGPTNQETLRKPPENIPGNACKTLLWEIRLPCVLKRFLNCS